jgi:hypothetical protein
MGLRRGRHELTRRQLPHIRAGPHRSARDIRQERGAYKRIRFLRKCLAGISQTNHKYWCENFYHDGAIKPDCNREDKYK